MYKNIIFYITRHQSTINGRIKELSHMLSFLKLLVLGIKMTLGLEVLKLNHNSRRPKTHFRPIQIIRSPFFWPEYSKSNFVGTIYIEISKSFQSK